MGEPTYGLLLSQVSHRVLAFEACSARPASKVLRWIHGAVVRRLSRGNRPRLPRSSSQCTLTLFDGDIGSSPSLELTTTDSSLADDDWNDRASSAVVSGGCQWILYDTDFEENSTISSVVGPANYLFNFSSNETTFGLPDNALSAVRCLPPEGTPAIVLFEHHRYFGQMQVINSSNPNLALINFDNTWYHLLSSLVERGSCTLEQTTLALMSHSDKVSIQMQTI